MPKIALELINLDRNQHKLYLLPEEFDHQTLKDKLDFDNVEWEGLDELVNKCTGGTRVDAEDIPEGTLTHWFELND